MEESILENENEEGDNQNQTHNEEGDHESHEEHNISQDLTHAEIDNQILRYLEQQHQN